MNRVSLKTISKIINSGLTPLRSNDKFWLDGNIPWVKTEQLGEKYIYDSNEKITKYALENTSIKLNPANTLSIAMYGEGKTRGSVSILKNVTTTNQACCNIVIDEKKADFEFVYYNLKTQYDNLRNLSSGVRKNLNSNDIKSFEIFLPNLSTQKQIAKVLSDLDAKIEVNNKINAELEAMAKLIYDYWFVQFDFPFDFAQGKPDPKGKPYKSSGGKMVYHKELKREIPEGWEVKTIGDLVDCNKWNRTKETKFSSINYLDTSSLTRNVVDSVQELIVGFDKIPSRAQRIVSQNDILYSTVRPNQEHFGIIKLPMENLVASTGFAQIRSKNIKFTNDYIYQFLCQDYVAVRLQQIAEGSVSAYPSISHNDIMDLKIVLPIKGKLIEKANTIFRQYNEKIALNLKQNQKLSELRDWILPMLMNGQVTVANEELGITNAELGNDLGMVAEEAGNYKLRK